MVTTIPAHRIETEGDPDSDLFRMVLDPSPEWTQKWIESFLTIDDEHGQVVHFKLYPQQIQMLRDQTGRDITLKGRQTRASSLILARNLRRMTSGFGLKQILMTQDDQTTATFRARLKHHLRDLEHHGLHYKLALDNDDELVITDVETGDKMENRYMFTSGEQRVAGRAYTGHLVHLSEMAHYPHDKARKLLGDITPSVPGSGWFDIESTPFGAEGPFYDYAEGAKPINPNSQWTAHLYPWWMEPRYTAGTTVECDLRLGAGELETAIRDFQPSHEEATLIANFGLRAEQILWRRARRIEMAKTDVPMLQEYVETWETCWIAAAGNYFSSPDGVDHLAYYRQGLRDSLLMLESLPYKESTISFYGPNLRIFEPPTPGQSYCGWLDCAGGGLSEQDDYTTLCVINANTMHHVATLRVKCAPNEAGPMACAVMQHYNKGLLGGERDAYGATALRVILEILHYPNVYYYIDPARPRQEMKAWAHPNQVREKILSCLRSHVFEHSLDTRDKLVLREMGSFTWQKYQGQRKAMGKQSHDDLVISMAGAVFIAPHTRGYRNPAQPEEEETIVVGAHGLVLGREKDSDRSRKNPW